MQTLRKNKRAAGMDFKEVFGKDHADSFLLLESGRADAFVMDGQILAGLISKSKNPADYKIVGEVLSVEPIAIMMRKDDPAFKKAVDDSIAAHDQERRDGQDVRQVVHAADPAGQHQGRPAGVSEPPRRPGPTRTTSRWKSTRRSNRAERTEVSPGAVRRGVAYSCGSAARAIRVALFRLRTAFAMQKSRACERREPWAWDWQVFLQDTGGGADLPATG